MERVMKFNVLSTLKSTVLFSFGRSSPISLKPICLLLPCLLSSQAFAISSITAQTIQGHAPILSFDGGVTAASNLDELLTVTLPDGTILSPSNVTASPLEPIYTFNQFVTLITADGSDNSIPATYYFDSDGDVPHATEPIGGTLSAVWTDVDGNQITNLSEPLDLCHQPYTLTIAANDVSANSQYGNPISSHYGTQSQAYTVNLSGSKLCYLKPMTTGTTREWVRGAGMSAQWNRPNGIVPDPNGGGGVTDDYIILKGFIPEPATGKKFPTTGFSQASFEMSMSDGQSAYTFSVQATPANSVTIDSLGSVTLVSKPTGAVTLTATPNSGQPPINYTFNIDLWASPATIPVVWRDAETYCGGNTDGLLTRAEMTSSPAKNAPQNWSFINNYLTRTVDGSLTGEWGYLIAYAGANWNSDFYWTKESYDETQLFVVNGADGKVSFLENAYDDAMLACRE